ncbi:ATP-binding protein [Moraxella sp. FZLJ2107]|uniref:ATP-binding protein n=1 Tax=unclassified Moraxella TaxID=2685852 RepID=UPI0020C8D71A|nr:MULTISPECIES: ATP-binding protein [unclassified Moraxella]UTO06099.1 ATP-binding protein [Moraxella sp. FZLJ2107]UTO22836.1 ATP-binding protein [Moraxella sp. FZLJ2109]
MSLHARTLLGKIRYRLHSNTMQTVAMVIFIVFVSVTLSLWLIWRSLYRPEIQNHATYLASEIKLLTSAKQEWRNSPDFVHWLTDNTHVEIVTDPREFPDVTDKVLVTYITEVFAEELERSLGRPAKVYFKFKPEPKLWIQDSANPNIWIREPMMHYSQYSTGVLAGFVFGIPLLTILTIWILIRGLNRPLRKLERAASDYILQGHATTLPTQTGPSEIRKVNTAFNRLFTTLSQAQKERTIMLAGISHDLRTPLTRMRLTAEMLPDEFFREGLVYDIEDMDAILDQFISFMKDGSDEPVKLTNLDTIFKEIMIQFDGTRFIYDSSIDQSVPVRPLSIKRLIVNLVNNAIRYGSEPIHLMAKITPAIDEDSDELLTRYPVLTISVKDEGEGVAEDQLERIMQPFERGESARTTQGSGLGLAIVSRIAHLHQGEVIAQNHPDGGLQVLINIPLMTAVANDHKDSPST